MNEPNISRNVWKPAFGHFATLAKAKHAARYCESILVVWEAEKGYKLASEPLPGYDVITRKMPDGKWTYRADNINARMHAVVGSQGQRK